MAVRVGEPFVAVVVFHDTEYGAAVTSDPRFAPSNWNCTPATPTLSDAVADTVIVPATDAPFAGDVSDTVGAVVSTVTVTGFEVVRFPAASRAIAAKMCDPFVAVA